MLKIKLVLIITPGCSVDFQAGFLLLITPVFVCFSVDFEVEKQTDFHLSIKLVFS